MFQDPLDCDPYFHDFNVSGLRDPTLQSRLNHEELFFLVFRSRQGDRQALDLLADTFYGTLSKRTAEMFERLRAYRPVPHREWVTIKFCQLLDVLLYDGISAYRTDGVRCFIENPEEGCNSFRSEGPSIEPRAIEATIRPEDIERVNWHDLVRAVCSAKDPAERLSTLVTWLKAHRQAWRLTALPESGWEKNGERDQVILRGLECELKRERICGELDRNRIAVNLPALTIKGFRTWAEAWSDPDGRQAIQRLFSKLVPRLDPVKSFVLSE